MPISHLQIAQSCAESAKKKLFCLESILNHGKDQAELHDPDSLWAISQFIYDAAKDVEGVLHQLEREGIS